MNYSMLKPCDACPFKRGTCMKLSKKRIQEIAGMMKSRNGGEFPCHKFLDYSKGEGERKDSSQHCAGALIFAEKHQNATQMMRIAERVRLYDAGKLMANKENVDLVFDTIAEMKKEVGI